MSYNTGTFYGFTDTIKGDVSEAINKIAFAYDRPMPQGVTLRQAGNLFLALRSATNSLVRLENAINEVREQ